MVYLKYIRKNNVLEFSDGSQMPFIIRKDEHGYYATIFAKPFDLLMISKVELSYNILGYYINGCFPYCKTEKDVFKLLRGLQKESKIKYYLANEL